MKISKKVVMFVRIVVILAVFALSIILVKSRPTERTSLNSYASTDIEYSDGTSAHFDSKNFGMVSKGDVVTVHLKLPKEPIVQDGVLAFYIYHSVTEIRCNGKLIDSYGADIAERGDMVGNARFLTPIPDEAWGGEISITLKVTENDAFTRIKNLWLYEKQNAYSYYIDSDFLGFFIGLPLFLVGIVAFLVFIKNGFKEASARKGAYIALFSVLASVWMLASKGVGHLFGLNGYFWSYAEFVAVFTMAIPILLYAYETEERGNWLHRALGITVCVQSGFFVLSAVLNHLNILHYCRTLYVSEAITFVGGVLLLIFAVRQIMHSTETSFSFFVGLAILFVAGLFDILRINVFKYIPALQTLSLPSVLPLGVLFFSIYLIRAYYSEVVEKQKAFLIEKIKAENLNEMFSNTPAGICMFSIDDELPIIQANDTFFSIFGYTAEGAAAAGFDNLSFPLKAETREMLRDQDKALMESNCPKNYELELNITKADGSEAVILSKFFFRGNGDKRITANVIDITDRKHMEEELLLSEERYKLALTQSGKVFFFFDVPSKTMRLSEELADAFGLPMEVDNMPDNFISQGLVEESSVEDYREFYNRIYAGEPSGDTVISCHMRQTPEEVLWYKIAFTSIFDANGKPASAVITYENLMEKREREIAESWKQINLVSMRYEKYSIAEYNITKNRLIRESGGLFEKMPDFITNYDEIVEFVCNNFIQESDSERYKTFLNRKRIEEMFESGKSEDSIEYCSLQSGSDQRWTSTNLQLIRDPYSHDLLAQLLFRDINDERVGQIRMMENMEDLKKELENSRIKVMINQMQPHFLYNALSAIQTIVKSDPDYAYQLIYDFTVHLRSSIKALSSDAPIPFNDELKNIKAYLNIEKMRFGDCLQVEYEINCDCFSVIPLSIQPLAENAARHGIYAKGDEGGLVTVRTYETEEAYVVEVEDNGVGFDVDAVMSTASDSVGLKSLIFRLKSLMDADVVINSKLGAGTKATVFIPKKEE